MFLKEHNPNKIWLALLNHAPSIRPRLASAGREAPCGSAIKQSNQTGLTGRISPHTTKPWKKSQYFERSRRPNSQKFYDEIFMQTAEKAPRFQAHPPQSLDLVQFWEQWVVQELETIGSQLMFTCIPSHLQLSWLCRSQPGQPLPQMAQWKVPCMP